MIRPSKYIDLDTSVLNVAAVLLTELQTLRAVSLNELSDVVTSRINASAKYNFFPALSFLYMTGKVEYDENADAIVYLIKKSEKVR